MQLIPLEKIQREGGRLIFNAYVYWIWRARNLKIFEGKNSTTETLFQLILYDVRVRIVTNNYTMEESPNRLLMEERWGISIEVGKRRTIRTKWIKPLIGVVKLNTDGSLSNTAKWGAAVRDHEGGILAVAHEVSPFSSIDEIELDAVM